MTIKTYLPIFIISIAAMILTGCSKRESGIPDAFTQNERLARGVNILGNDPIWVDMDRSRFKAEYFGMLREGGFSSVRFNLSPFNHMDENNNYQLDEKWIKVFEWVVEHALDNDLMVILDLHENGKMNRGDFNKWEPYFVPFWQQIATRYKDLPPDVIFELLNEPGRQITPEIWNRMMNEAIGIIRETNPKRTIITGPAGAYQNFDYLDEMRLPQDDRNIIITVHYYRPSVFTHQSASWMEHSRDTSGVLWSGYPEERHQILKDLQQVRDWAERNRYPVFLGEFGVYGLVADIYSQVEWTSYVARTAEEMGFSWSLWRFKGGFRVYDIDHERWYTPIYDALIPKEDKPFHREDRMMVAGRMRRHILQFPSGDITKNLPVVFSFHENGRRPEDIKRWARLDSVAHNEGFLIVYPEAELPWLAWQPETDTLFIMSVINKLKTDLNIDTRRIYATGLSKGGEMARFLGTHCSNAVTAAAAAETVPEGEEIYPGLDRDVPVRITLIQDGEEQVWPWQETWGTEASRVIWDFFDKLSN